jgi:hypothetical protein
MLRKALGSASLRGAAADLLCNVFLRHPFLLPLAGQSDPKCSKACVPAQKLHGSSASSVVVQDMHQRSFS